MRVLIASDKFKGSATGPEVAAALAGGIRETAPGTVVEAAAVADGGEGTVDAAIEAGFEPVTATVTGPVGVAVPARLAIRGREAVIETAAASGLGLVPPGTNAATTATSRGTGELIRAALDRGCTSIVLGAGGSACTDGGAGMLQALGARLWCGTEPVSDGGLALAGLTSVDLSNLDRRIADTAIILASDVDNPLLGDRGAAAVFAPQKGARPEEVPALDAALARLVELLTPLPGVRAVADAPGAGAAGGVGYAALAVLAARRVPGVEVVQRLTGLADRMAGADLVVTGEGSLDAQSLGGKAPLGVAALARAAGIPVIAVCGRSRLDATQARAAGFSAVYALSSLEPDGRRSIANARALLRQVGRQIGRDSARLVALRDGGSGRDGHGGEFTAP